MKEMITGFLGRGFLFERSHLLVEFRHVGLEAGQFRLVGVLLFLVFLRQIARADATRAQLGNERRQGSAFIVKTGGRKENESNAKVRRRKRNLGVRRATVYN